MPDEYFVCPPELERFMRYQPAQAGPTSANLLELEQLLYAIWGKQTGKTELDQQVLAHFQTRCGLDQDLVAEQEQRVLRLLDKKQPILVGLDTHIECNPGHPSVINALVMNPTETLFREVRIRFHSADLCLEGHVQPSPIRLLDGRDTLPVCFSYLAPQQSMLTTLVLEVDVCDHRGEWRAYNSRSGVLLNFPPPGGDNKVKIRASYTTHSELYRPRGGRAEEGWSAPTGLGSRSLEDFPVDPQLPRLEQMLPLELEPDLERTRRLQAAAAAGPRLATRGTPVTRALLRSQTSDHAPERIELVSRPFMVFGRYNERSQAGFGDFALGFVTDYRKISRFHCAVRATEDGLAVMHAGTHNRGYTALNGRRLNRGDWQRLDSEDTFDIGGLYTLRITLAFDVTPGLAGHDPALLQGEELGRYLLQVIDSLREAETDSSDAVQEKLKEAYANLVRMQSKTARYNGIDSAGKLIYARFLREDPESQRVIHFYLPKWLPVGSASTDGLCIQADGVRRHHAELLYKDSMYWIQNHAEQGDVRVCNHGLAPNEAIPLEEGDTIGIGAARFLFERY